MVKGYHSDLISRRFFTRKLAEQKVVESYTSVVAVLQMCVPSPRRRGGGERAGTKMCAIPAVYAFHKKGKAKTDVYKHHLHMF